MLTFPDSDVKSPFHDKFKLWEHFKNHGKFWKKANLVQKIEILYGD